LGEFEMPGIYRNPESLLAAIETWLRDKLRSAGGKGGIVGLSGGIDSAVVAAILKRTCGERMLAVIMPCHSHPEDRLHAELAAGHYGLPLEVVDLTSTYDSLVAALPSEDGSSTGIARANIKPRLRMATLYFLAQERNMLVCGTGNRVELAVGYFTKHGDSGVDLLPLGDLLKGEVRELARLLGVPRRSSKNPHRRACGKAKPTKERWGFPTENWIVTLPREKAPKKSGALWKRPACVRSTRGTRPLYA